MRLNELFFIPRNDRRMMLAFLVVMSMIGIVFFLFGSQDNASTPSHETIDDSLDAARRHIEKRRRTVDFVYDEGVGSVRKIFDFDPNTADSTQLLALGLSPWQVRSLYRYRNKGGVFRSKEDFSRLYGLTERQYRELSPHIVISPDYLPARRRYAEGYDDNYNQLNRDTLKFPIKLKPGATIALNSLDTAELKKVPGIGSVRARAIVRYNNKLGGFYDVKQLLEVEGLTEEELKFFRNDHKPVEKININRATINQMRRHPYINFYQARAIDDYRRLKGKIKDISDLRLLNEFGETDIERLRHYVGY